MKLTLEEMSALSAVIAVIFAGLGWLGRMVWKASADRQSIIVRLESIRDDVSSGNKSIKCVENAISDLSTRIEVETATLKMSDDSLCDRVSRLEDALGM